MKRWSQDKENILRQYYPNYGSKYCAKLLNKTRDAIKLKASRLGLQTHFVSGYWTKKEDAVLVKYYTEYGSKYCSKWLDKSLPAIRGRAVRLGLSTNIVAYGFCRRRIIKRLDNNKIISLCKTHGETLHYFRNRKINECIQCHRKRMIERARTDDGRVSMRKAHQKYRSTPIGKFVCRLRVSLNNALRSKNIVKTRKGCLRLLPYSPQELTQHLEKIRSFQDNKCPMCHKSYDTSGWTIDHVKPVKTAKTEEDVLKLFSLNNLSLLCQSCNSSKGAKIWA